MGLPSTFPDPSLPIRHSTGILRILGQGIACYDVLFEIKVLENGLYLSAAGFQDVVPLSAPGSHGHGDIVLLQVVYQFFNTRQERHGRPCFILALISAPQIILYSEGDIWEK